jgi:hypothetical protein
VEYACNIGPAQQRRRLWFGIPLLVIGVVASFFTRNFLAQVVAFFGFLGVFQARAGTCVALAARGAKDLDRGMMLLDDPDEIAYFRGQARRIYLKTFLATLVLLLVSQAWIIFFRH